MSLSQRSRTAIFEGLTEVIGDEQAVEDFMSQFPSRDLDEPVTKEFLRAEMAELGGALRGEMANLSIALRGEMADLSIVVRSEMSSTRSDLRAEMSSTRSDLRAEIADLRVEMHRGFHRLTITMVAVMVSMTGAVAAVVTVGT